MVSAGIICAVLFACSVRGVNARADGGLQIARLSSEFKLKAGQQVTLKGARLRIRFVTVENDSRCPSDVTCVWAGNAAVRLQLSNGRSSRTVTLNTSSNASFAREVEYQGYKVTLVDLNPHPRSDRKIAARDYITTLRVSKAEQRRT
jgi:hypothetical protein